MHGDNFTYLSDYISNKSKIKIKCNTCNNIFFQRVDSHLDGCGCRKCQYLSMTQNQPKTIKNFESECNLVHDKKYEYCGDYKSCRNKIKIFCKVHQEYFYQNADAHLSKGQGCPKCRLSRGELRIEKYLKENNIIFEYEKKFNNCKFKQLLPFDFYLPKYNTCIEYDGEFHYITTKHFGGDKKLQNTQRNDLIKNEFCKNNNIKLIRIPFPEFNNIEKVLKEELTC